MSDKTVTSPVAYEYMDVNACVPMLCKNVKLSSDKCLLTLS